MGNLHLWKFEHDKTSKDLEIYLWTTLWWMDFSHFEIAVWSIIVLLVKWCVQFRYIFPETWSNNHIPRDPKLFGFCFLFTKEIKISLAKPPLEFNGGLSKRWLTSTEYRPLEVALPYLVFKESYSHIFNTIKTWGRLINVLRVLQNTLSKFVYCTNCSSYKSSKLKLCMCAKSHALGTSPKFHL